MKTKDKPSVRARRSADDAYREMTKIPCGGIQYVNALHMKSRMIHAYMAGYRHGRKMKEAKS